MKKNILIKKLQDYVYNRTVYLAIGPRKQVVRELEKLLKVEKGELCADENAAGCVYYMPDGSYVLWLHQYKGSIQCIDILSHEILHLVHACLSLVGLPLCDHSEEAYAYYTGFWMKQILTVIKHNK